MLRWKKLGKVFTPAGRAGPALAGGVRPGARHARASTTVVRVYLLAAARRRTAHGQYVSYGRVRRPRSRRPLARAARQRSEPILVSAALGEFDEFGTYPVSVDPGRRDESRAYYGGWTRCESVPFNVAIGMATKATAARRFARLGSGPVIPIHARRAVRHERPEGSPLR